MNIVILLILSSVVAASIFLIAFLWAAASGQYDDVHTPAVRMLFEDKLTSTFHSPLAQQGEGVGGEENPNHTHGT